jgi:predicted signal transduction protein with EAL and GGDEF domain
MHMASKIEELEARVAATVDNTATTEHIDALNELSWETKYADAKRALDLSRRAYQTLQSPAQRGDGGRRLLQTDQRPISHQVGDEVIKRVGRILHDSCRMIDVAARYGGEEFVLLLVETPAMKAAVLCEKIRMAVEICDWSELHPAMKVSISMGISDDLAVAQPEAMLAAADAKLYQAKRGGRNRVVWSASRRSEARWSAGGSPAKRALARYGD